MRRPITLAMVVVAVIGGGGLALKEMRVDIFPSINAPQIYVVNNYAGMDPSQIEGIITNVYEQNFQYVDGIKAIESKNIQNFVQLKLTFYPGTDMAAAMSQVVSLTNRARGQMPPSVLPPFVIRFDAASVPIGYLVMESKSQPPRPLGELADLGLFRIRPTLIAEVPGTVAFSPYGSNTRAIVVSVNPDLLRAHNLSPEDLVSALETGNVVVPSGNLYAQSQMPLVPTNAMVVDPQEMGKIPIQLGKDVLPKDVATIEDTTDINYGCALVNGRKSIFIPVVKKDTASTLTVVRQIHDTMPKFKSLVPDDVERPLRVRRIAHSAGGHQERGHGRGHRRRADGADDPSLPARSPQCDRGPDQHPLVLDKLVDRPVAYGQHHQHHVAGRAGPGHRHSCRRGDGHHREHACPNAAYAFHRPGCAAGERRYEHGATVGDALHPLGVHSHVHSQRAGPLAIHAVDAGRGLRHDRLLPALQHAGARAHRLAGGACRAGRAQRVAVRSLSRRLCQGGGGDGAFSLGRGRDVLGRLSRIDLDGRPASGHGAVPRGRFGPVRASLPRPSGVRVRLDAALRLQILDIIDDESHGNLEMSIGYTGLGSTNTATNNILLFMRASDDGVLRVRLRENSGVAIADLRERCAKSCPKRWDHGSRIIWKNKAAHARKRKPVRSRFPSASSRATSSVR